MNATSLRDERVVKQLPTGGWGRGEAAFYPRTLWRCRQNSDHRDYVGNNWILLFLSHCGFGNATAKIKREPHPWWTSDARAENKIKREIMMNSQSVPEASFAPHESDRVWSRRECHPWPSRKNLARQSAPDHRWPLLRAAERALSQLSTPRRFLQKERAHVSRAHVSRRFRNAEGWETSRTLQLGFRNKIMMFRGSQVMFAYVSIGPGSAAPRLRGHVCRGGANLNPLHQLCFAGVNSLVCQWGDVKPFPGQL